MHTIARHFIYVIILSAHNSPTWRGLLDSVGQWGDSSSGRCERTFPRSQRRFWSQDLRIDLSHISNHDFIWPPCPLLAQETVPVKSTSGLHGSGETVVGDLCPPGHAHQERSLVNRSLVNSTAIEILTCTDTPSHASSPFSTLSSATPTGRGTPGSFPRGPYGLLQCCHQRSLLKTQVRSVLSSAHQALLYSVPAS